MSHIREMALDVTPDSLVLLDEIGSATDPEEGGALGVALVEHFRASGAYTLATTHLLALKIYGANTKSVLNASMGFDEVSLEPTYQLKLGLPGKSAGLDIATRLGMPEDIMKRARASLSDRELDIAKFLRDLHAKTEQVAKLEAATDAGARGIWRSARSAWWRIRKTRERRSCGNWKIAMRSWRRSSSSARTKRSRSSARASRR